MKVDAGEKGVYNVQEKSLGDVWHLECLFGGIGPSSKASITCGENGAWSDLDTTLCLTKLVGVNNIIHEIGMVNIGD